MHRQNLESTQTLWILKLQCRRWSQHHLLVVKNWTVLYQQRCGVTQNTLTALMICRLAATSLWVMARPWLSATLWSWVISCDVAVINCLIYVSIKQIIISITYRSKWNSYIHFSQLLSIVTFLKMKQILLIQKSNAEYFKPSIICFKKLYLNNYIM